MSLVSHGHACESVRLTLIGAFVVDLEVKVRSVSQSSYIYNFALEIPYCDRGAIERDALRFLLRLELEMDEGHHGDDWWRVRSVTTTGAPEVGDTCIL